ncbi:hypothetical protein ACFE04_011202 [Oxalis oulophora]
MSNPSAAGGGGGGGSSSSSSKFKAGASQSSKVGASQSSETFSFKRKRGMFQKDLQHMMYGFGDDPNPLPKTVTLVEEIVVEYVTVLRDSFSAYAMVGFVPRTHSVEWNGAGAHTNYRVYKYGNSIVVENIDSTL